MRTRRALSILLLSSLVVAGWGSVEGDGIAKADSTEVVRGYGLRIELPAGWRGDIFRPPPGRGR